MFNFLNKDKNENENKKDTLIEVACLLIHASKIDENYSDKEREIISKALKKLDANDREIENIISEAEIIEKDSNQILDFTKNLKNVENEKKLFIVETLWRIIYSDKTSDMYESNLMRRLTGLLYLSAKEVGDIKEKIKLEYNE